MMDAYKSYGSIEGRLDAILLQRKPAFKVYDSTEKGTLCYFDKVLLNEVQAALGKKVSVLGLLHTTESRGVLKVDVNPIDVSLCGDNLPTLDVGILS